MTAIITDKIKKLFVQTLFDELAGVTPGDSDNYYNIAIGRSQQYNPVANNDIAPTPTNTEREERLFRYNMQAVKVTEAYSFVIPTHDYTINTQYAAFNDNVSGHPDTSYYVRTAENNVYMCIKTGKNSVGEIQVSTQKPVHTDTSLPKESDGYVWKYLYTITTANSNSFLTSEFMPVKYVDSAAPTSPEAPQKAVQNAAVPGQIIGYRVTNTGGPYSSAPSITIAGNGSSASAHAVLNASGGLAAIEVDSNGSGDLRTAMGSGYDYATVTISDALLDAAGTSAKAVPIFGPKDGVGANPINDLRATSLMFNIKPIETVDGTWPVGNDYRQIGVIKNITNYGSATQFTGTSGVALKRMTLTTLPGIGAISFAADVELTGSTSGASAWLDYYDDSNTLWYHQDESTGFTAFDSGENVVIEGYGTLAIETPLINPDVDIFSGELLYIDNRATAITRSAAGTEDIKVVIKL